MSLLSIALIGYGNLGKEIARIAESQQTEISSIIHRSSEQETMRTISPTSLCGAEVAIEVTSPDAVFDNVRLLAEQGVNAVVGTTGWQHREQEMREIVESSKIGLIWASNFSIGVYLYRQMVENAAKIMNLFADYDVYCHEFHHNKKADSPSGTANTLAQTLVKNIQRKTEILSEASHQKIRPEQLHVTSTRAGNIPGTHTVSFDSLADTIELTHRARSRTGFALGALKAAKWIRGKRGFYGIEDMMNELLAKENKRR